jgi:sRNA-binding carbon storage regulator CsrA
MRLGIEAPRSVVVDRGEVDASRRQQAVIEATRQRLQQPPAPDR